MRGFSSNQIKRFSNILDNAGQVVLASVVVQPIVSGLSPISLFTVFGIITVVVIWSLALLMEGGVYNE